jgi:hypothetical protein
LFKLLEEPKTPESEPAEPEFKVTKLPFYGMGKASVSSTPNTNAQAAPTKKVESQRGKQSVIREESYESMSVTSSAMKTSQNTKSVHTPKVTKPPLDLKPKEPNVKRSENSESPNAVRI